MEFDPVLIRKKSEELDLEIVLSPGGVWPLQADLSDANKDNRLFGLKWHKHWIDMACEIGATAYTGALYSHPGHVDKRKIMSEDIKYASENLFQLASYSEQKKVKIVLEPMSHFRVSLINTPLQVMDLIEKIGNDNVFVLMDTYHLVTEVRDFCDAVNTMNPRLWGIHACENDRGVPGKGIVPWNSIFSTLKNNHFSGYFILETYNSSINNGDFAFSRAMFHNICPSGDEFVKNGMQFIQSKFC